MAVSRCEYLVWQKGNIHRPVEVGLHMSGMPNYPVEELIRDPGDLNPSRHQGDGYGVAALRAKVAEVYGVPVAEVFMTLATSQANSAALQLLAPPGSTVVFEAPTYDQMTYVSRIYGHNVRYVQRRFETGWQLDLAEVEQTLTEGAKVVVVSDLFNPGGVGLGDHQVEALTSLCERAGATLLIDEVYRDFPRLDTPRSHRARGGPVVCTGSLTKVYGLGYIRVGWVLGPADFVKDLHLRVDGMYANMPTPSEVIALRALEQRSQLVTWIRERVIPARAMVDRYFEVEKRLSWVPPEGGLVGFVKLPEGVDAQTFCQHLEQRHNTRVVGGHWFGDPRFFRLGFGIEPDLLRKGLAKLSRTLDEWQG